MATGPAALDPRTPVIVAVGQAEQRPDDLASALEPAALLAEAARRAQADSGSDRLLGTVDTVAVVHILSHTYRNPAAAVAGLGGCALVGGAIALSPVLAGPFVRLAGAVMPRLAGKTGQLARENALRNPRRTATTASALMIGLALVSGFAILGSSMKASVDAAVGDTLQADYVVANAVGQPFTSEVAADLAALDGVRQRPSPRRGGGVGGPRQASPRRRGHRSPVLAPDPCVVGASVRHDRRAHESPRDGRGARAATRVRAGDRRRGRDGDGRAAHRRFGLRARGAGATREARRDRPHGVGAALRAPRLRAARRARLRSRRRGGGASRHG